MGLISALKRSAVNHIIQFMVGVGDGASVERKVRKYLNDESGKILKKKACWFQSPQFIKARPHTILLGLPL
jgi:hypothetical protein